ncbi:energy-coupling factor transporter transmembrane component T [Corynebacterium uterequi]|uniref:ABC-type cobalt transport system, permease component CbiQ n=1 Tax=Corynebacterium uterequi TaxID=1072256 RepID=A0A0G3HJQ6_9CORY|nr:energy-coupling factor transporter transmembrane component T [Corynebacterium uterequi]AKK12153.1 ABC-type cobalt transport system, permease component CbiQ [Corynebacterium uterequi]
MQRIDPRTGMAVVLTANAWAWMSHVPLWAATVIPLLAAVGLAVAGYSSVARWLLGATFAALVLTYLPFLAPNLLTHAAGAVGYWTTRMIAACSSTIWFVLALRFADVLESLYQLRLPSAAIIPLAVLYRFLPIACVEIQTVWRAMTLRGYTGWQLLQHPVASAERVAVPTLAAAARTSDALAASALLRGMGTATRPTALSDLRFRPVDAAVLALCALAWVVILRG